MTSVESAGYREREHTADWELEAWAPDLDGLFTQCAAGMFALAGTRLVEAAPQPVFLSLQAADPESLLVAFLSELLYYGEQSGLGFAGFDLHTDGVTLEARLAAVPLAGRDKEIKAVTYHGLHIRQTDQGLVVNIVFDV